MNDRRLRVPLLLRVAMVLGGLFGIVGTAAGLVVLVDVVVSDRPFSINENPVSRGDFLAIAAPFIAFYVAACVTAGSAAWSLWKRQRRARLLLTALLAEFVVGDTAMLLLAKRLNDMPAAELLFSAIAFTGLVALALWYLFRKRAVVEYFESLQPSHSEMSTAHSS